jgi:hypothetical protein
VGNLPPDTKFVDDFSPSYTKKVKKAFLKELQYPFGTKKFYAQKGGSTIFDAKLTEICRLQIKKAY